MTVVTTTFSFTSRRLLRNFSKLASPHQQRQRSLPREGWAAASDNRAISVDPGGRMESQMKNRTFRSAAIAFSAAAISISLAACGSSGPAGTAGSADSATMWGLTGGNEPVLQKSVTDWNSAHPDSSIKLDFFANDAYKTKVRTAVGAGQGPTFIYGWGGGVLKSYVDAGQVDDLTAYPEGQPRRQVRYLPAVLKNGDHRRQDLRPTQQRRAARGAVLQQGSLRAGGR